MLLERLYRWRLALTLTLIGALAGVLRFVGLGYPKALVFDELYYARESYSLLELGYGGKWKGENQAFAHGDLSGLTNTPDGVVHPMVGKYMIAAGEWIFGPTPFGWRFAGAVTGTASVILLILIARHLFRSLTWGALAGLFLAIDGQHIVLSRTSILDIFLSFWALVAFGLFLLDRRRATRTLERKASADRARYGLAPGERIPGLGPGLGIRWWRLAALVAIGLATGVKWSGLYFGAGFVLLSALWDAADRRAAGYRHWLPGSALRATVPAAVTTVVVVPLTYLATYWSWFVSSSSYDRHWAEQNPGEGVTWLPAPLRSLLHYHEWMYHFHVNVTPANGYSHGYSSNPFLWLFQWRPTAFYYVSDKSPSAQDVCGAKNCASAITALGNPVIWWAATIVLFYALYRVIVHVDMLALTVVAGTLAGWVPWLFFSERIIFTFYTVAFVPYVVLTLVWGLRQLAQPPDLEGGWSRIGGFVAGGFTALALIVAGYFVPLWTGQWIPYYFWHAHMWLGKFWI